MLLALVCAVLAYCFMHTVLGLIFMQGAAMSILFLYWSVPRPEINIMDQQEEKDQDPLSQNRRRLQQFEKSLAEIDFYIEKEVETKQLKLRNGLAALNEQKDAFMQYAGMKEIDRLHTERVLLEDIVNVNGQLQVIMKFATQRLEVYRSNGLSSLSPEDQAVFDKLEEQMIRWATFFCSVRGGKELGEYKKSYDILKRVNRHKLDSFVAELTSSSEADFQNWGVSYMAVRA